MIRRPRRQQAERGASQRTTSHLRVLIPPKQPLHSGDLRHHLNHVSCKKGYKPILRVVQNLFSQSAPIKGTLFFSIEFVNNNGLLSLLTFTSLFLKDPESEETTFSSTSFDSSIPGSLNKVSSTKLYITLTISEGFW